MTSATEIMLKQEAALRMQAAFLSAEGANMTTRPIKTSMEQLVRILIRNYEVQNFGKRAKYIYLPPDLYDHFTDVIEDHFRRMGVDESVFDDAYQYFYDSIEVLQCRTIDIIVTDELLP